MKNTLLLIVSYIVSLNAVLIAQQTVPAMNNSNLFIENKGQWDNEVLFLSKLNGYNAWITKTGVVYDFYRYKTTPDNLHGESSTTTFNHQTLLREGHVIHMQFQNSNPFPKERGIEKSKAVHNYFSGNDPGKWHSEVALYQEVMIEDVYDGIHVRYYLQNGQLRYDFIVEEGANPTAICFELKGSLKTTVNTSRELVFKTKFGDVKQADLTTFQTINGERVMVESAFKITDNYVSFDLKTYEVNQKLTIDPLVYATFLGGSNADYGMCNAIDSQYNQYVAGYTSSNNFPTTVGAYDLTVSATDIFVSKVNDTGTALIYSTYIGGSGNDYANAIAIDAANNIYLTGETYSNNYPTTAGAYNANPVQFSAVFVTKLNTTGTALSYSAMLGSGLGFGITVSASGNATVTGYTGYANFPVTVGCFDATHNGSNDVFVTKLNIAGSGLVFSTFVGGTGIENATGITSDASGNSYVVGTIWNGSIGFPSTAGAYDQSYNGGAYDCFVFKLNQLGTALIYSTLIGGSSYEEATAIAISSSGNAYITGKTASNNFPTTAGAYDASNNGSEDVFVAKLSANGGALAYSTFLGSNGFDLGKAITVDNSGYAYVVGEAGSASFPTTPDAINSVEGRGFVSKISENGSQLLYSTFIDKAVCAAVKVDGQGAIYVAGTVVSFFSGVAFPVTANAFDITLNNTDAFALKIALLDPLPTELINFQGTPKEEYNLLSWQTVSETDSDYFTLEKSYDMVSWDEVTKLKGAGHSTELRSYYFEDFEKPKTEAAVIYYRLWQTDLNGNAIQSGIISLQNKNNEDDLFTVFPNPAIENINIVLNKTVFGRIELRTINGELVYQEDCMHHQYAAKTINTSLFASGVYFMSLTTEDAVQTKKIIINSHK